MAKTSAPLPGRQHHLPKHAAKATKLKVKGALREANGATVKAKGALHEAKRSTFKAKRAPTECNEAMHDTNATMLAVTLISWQAKPALHDTNTASHDTNGASHDANAALHDSTEASVGRNVIGRDTMDLPLSSTPAFH